MQFGGILNQLFSIQDWNFNDLKIAVVSHQFKFDTENLEAPLIQISSDLAKKEALNDSFESFHAEVTTSAKSKVSKRDAAVKIQRQFR